jgi:hypothetical protein
MIAYYAYGSNMCINRLQARISSCKVLAVGVLKEYALRFHKRSMDGSGKCNAFYTGNIADKVIGVIFLIVETEKPKLDRIEGLGNGYNEISVELETGIGVIKACTYIAETSFIDDGLLPYTWYKDFVLEGARQHRLDGKYIAILESTQTWSDPDPKREARERSLLPC